MVKLGQNPRLPLTLDEIDRELRRAFFGNFCIRASRSFFCLPSWELAEFALLPSTCLDECQLRFVVESQRAFSGELRIHVSPPINLEGLS